MQRMHIATDSQCSSALEWTRQASAADLTIITSFWLPLIVTHHEAPEDFLELLTVFLNFFNCLLEADTNVDRVRELQQHKIFKLIAP